MSGSLSTEKATTLISIGARKVFKVGWIAPTRKDIYIFKQIACEMSEIGYKKMW